MCKATYKGKSYGRGYDRGTTYLFYEYRGHEYMVEDRHWMPAASDMTLAEQHRREQARIDELIEQENKPVTHETVRYEDTAEYAIDQFMRFMNGEPSAFDEEAKQ